MTVQVHDSRLPGGMLEVDTDDPAQAAQAAKKYIAANAPPPPKAAPNTYADVIKSAATGVAKGSAAVTGFLGDLGNLERRGIQYLTDKLPAPIANVARAGLAPQQSGSSEGVDKGIQAVTGTYHVPETTPGRYAETIVSFAPAALGGEGTLLVRGARTVIPAVTSQVAGDLAQDTGLSPGWQTAARVGGAVAGAVVGNPAATGAIRSLNAAAVGKGLPPMLNPEAVAAAKMRDAVARDGGTSAVGSNIVDWQGSGASGPVLVDVGGNNVRRLVRGAASGGSGEAQNVATDYAGRIRANFQDQVIDHTNGLTPGVQDAANSYAARLKQAQRDTADTNYRAVKGQPVTMTPDALKALRGKPGQEAIAKAMEDAAANQDHETIADLQKLQVADLDHPPTVSAQALEAVRRSMGEIGAGKAATPGNAYGAAGYFGRKAGLDTALDATPGLKPARAAYAQMQAGRDAVDTGMGILSTPSSDYASAVSDLASRAGGPPNIGTPLQVGARQALVNRLETGADGATGPAKTISQASRATQNLGVTFGDARAARYQAALGNEVRRVGNGDFISPNTGSQTALRSGDESLLASVPTSKVEILGKIIDTLRGRGATLTDAERTAIVRLGTSEANLRALARRNPQMSSAAIAQIASANSSQPQ